MNKAKTLSAIRHTLTFLGGMAVMNGWVEEGVATEITGALMFLVGTLWGLAEKHTRPAA